jgi:dephospho-CoA kinase
MLRVGLTGNIATGKSHVSTEFAELGARVIDADHIAHELLCKGTETYAGIVEAFGKEVLDGDGNIDRKKLGNIIFFDPGKRAVLNGLTHPAIGSEIGRRIEALERAHDDGIVIIEAALLVEVGSYTKYHALVVVRCETSLQIERLVERDGLTVEAAKARIDSQMAMEEKLKLADYVIDTSGTMKDTHTQVEAVYRELLIRQIRRNETSPPA